MANLATALGLPEGHDPTNDPNFDPSLGLSGNFLRDLTSLGNALGIGRGATNRDANRITEARETPSNGTPTFTDEQLTGSAITPAPNPPAVESQVVTPTTPITQTGAAPTLDPLALTSLMQELGLLNAPLDASTPNIPAPQQDNANPLGLSQNSPIDLLETLLTALRGRTN